MTRYFEYGQAEVDYLAARDPRLAEVMTVVGHVYRELDDDLFGAVMHHIVGQQVSMAAQRTVWARMQTLLDEVSPATVLAVPDADLQGCGMTFRKVEYLKDFARRVDSGEFDLGAVGRMGDADAIAALASLRGIGVWTAEMLLLFCLGRSDVFSYDDLAIQRGLRMVYHHRKVTRPLFEKYRRRYSPYGSVASLYLWTVAGGGVPGFERDYAPLTEAQKRVRARERARARGGSKR